ncbi:MAG: hypothetical protein OER88_14860, partial [Planctomycetota bacterium]|nr:hypothetical protein [Planctomycetota bacterium]
KEDSWTAGQNGAFATIVFAATPEVGDVYFAYNPEGGLETLDVLALDASTVVPAGAFLNCAKLVENAHDDEDSDTILYAPGVGLVSEKHSRGKIVLVDLR